MYNRPRLNFMLKTTLKAFSIPHSSVWFTDPGGPAGLGWAHLGDCSQRLVGHCSADPGWVLSCWVGLPMNWSEMALPGQLGSEGHGVSSSRLVLTVAGFQESASKRMKCLRLGSELSSVACATFSGLSMFQGWPIFSGWRKRLPPLITVLFRVGRL